MITDGFSVYQEAMYIRVFVVHLKLQKNYLQNQGVFQSGVYFNI